MTRITLGLIVVLTLFAMTAASAASPTKFLDDPKVDELAVAASVDYLVWSADSEARPGHYNTYVRPIGGGPATRVNRRGTRSDSVGIDGSTVAYMVFNGSNDNLKLYDAVTQTRSGLPEVNTGLHEAHPSLSGDWLLFTRSKPGYWQKIILFNLSTGHSRVLRRSELGPETLNSDQVNGDWATFEHCRIRQGLYSNCNVFRYQISTKDLVKIPDPTQQDAGGVSQDGTVYLTRSRTDVYECGDRARIVRYPVDGPGVVIAKIRVGFEPWLEFATDEPDGSTTLYFERVKCSTGSSGIYRIANADTAT